MKYKRPKKLSRAKSNIVDAVVHGVNWCNDYYKENFTHVILLQPTSPIRDPEDIINAMDVFLSKSADSLLSVSDMHPFVWREDQEGNVFSFNYDYLNRPRRQDAPKDFLENGSFYC